MPTSALPSSALSRIASYVSSLPRGTIFFAEDLDPLGLPAEGVRDALSRLSAEGTVLVRLARGVYCHPRMAEGPYALDRLLPSPEEVAASLAARWRVRIVPCGEEAAFRAGLVPFSVHPLTFLSDGSPQHFNLQNGRRIEFVRRRSAKVFGFRSEDLRNLVEGFRWLGRGGVGEWELGVAASLLRRVPPSDFDADIRLAPSWIRGILRDLYPRNLPEGGGGAAPSGEAGS